MSTGCPASKDPDEPRVELEVRHEDILSAEADAVGILVTPALEPDDEASRRILGAAEGPLRADLRRALAARGRCHLEPGEAVTLVVRRDYPVGRVGFLVCAASARRLPPPEAEALVLRAFLREALEWGFESLALSVSEHGSDVTLAAARRMVASLPAGGRPALRRIQFLVRDAAAPLAGPAPGGRPGAVGARS